MDLTIALQERYHQFCGFQEALQRKCEEQEKMITEYKTKSHYWEAQFGQLKDRELTLLSEIDELKAALKKREQQLFGRRSEKHGKSSKKSNASAQDVESKKKRGQQPNTPGPGRRDHSHLPVVDEVVSLANPSCPCCSLPYESLYGTEDSTVLEIINVKGYQRSIHRKRYKRCCDCKENPAPQIFSAPVTEKIIPKSQIGISIWAKLLLGKYGYQQPLNRILEQLSNCGLSLSCGTVTEGFKRLLPLLVPVYDAMVERSLSANHWHADETGWKVFEPVENKSNSRWYLWIFHNSETVIFKIRPSRSAQVLKEHFDGHEGGILNVDRYGAYKVIAKSGLFVLAFCWAHVRRDFLEYAKGYPHQESWALGWVEKIGECYHLNQQRLENKPASTLFKQTQTQLKTALQEMQETATKACQERTLLPSQLKLLKSLLAHWEGLTIFLEQPEIPMDNNLAERGLRSSVVGRKNYYGSGSVWSANLAATLFTIFKTLKVQGINQHTWLLAYLHECASHGGQPPDDLTRYLPWSMSEQLKELFSRPPKHENIEPSI